MRILVRNSPTLKSYERLSFRKVYIVNILCMRTESKYSGQLSGSIAFPFPFPLVDCLAVRGFFEATSLGPAPGVSEDASAFLFLPAGADRCLGGILLGGRIEQYLEGREREAPTVEGVTTRCDLWKTRLVTSHGPTSGYVGAGGLSGPPVHWVDRELEQRQLDTIPSGFSLHTACPATWSRPPVSVMRYIMCRRRLVRARRRAWARTAVRGYALLYIRPGGRAKRRDPPIETQFSRRRHIILRRLHRTNRTCSQPPMLNQS